MPIIKLQVRAEERLASSELFTTAVAEKDSAGILDGVAMANLVGIVRQLGDLAEYAAGVFDSLNKEVQATALRGEALGHRVRRLEVQVPAVEEAILTDTNPLRFVSAPGVEWRASVHTEQNHFSRGDPPAFVVDAYKGCRASPQLSQLDRFHGGTAGACMRRYSDPSFLKREWAKAELAKARIDRQARQEERKQKRQSQSLGSPSAKRAQQQRAGHSREFSQSFTPTDLPLLHSPADQRVANIMSQSSFQDDPSFQRPPHGASSAAGMGGEGYGLSGQGRHQVAPSRERQLPGAARNSGRGGGGLARTQSDAVTATLALQRYLSDASSQSEDRRPNLTPERPGQQPGLARVPGGAEAAAAGADKKKKKKGAAAAAAAADGGRAFVRSKTMHAHVAAPADGFDDESDSDGNTLAPRRRPSGSGGGSGGAVDPLTLLRQDPGAFVQDWVRRGHDAPGERGWVGGGGGRQHQQQQQQQLEDRRAAGGGGRGGGGGGGERGGAHHHERRESASQITPLFGDGAGGGLPDTPRTDSTLLTQDDTPRTDSLASSTPFWRTAYERGGPSFLHDAGGGGGALLSAEEHQRQQQRQRGEREEEEEDSDGDGVVLKGLRHKDSEQQAAEEEEEERQRAQGQGRLYGRSNGAAAAPPQQQQQQQQQRQRAGVGAVAGRLAGRGHARRASYDLADMTMAMGAADEDAAAAAEHGRAGLTAGRHGAGAREARPPGGPARAASSQGRMPDYLPPKRLPPGGAGAGGGLRRQMSADHAQLLLRHEAPGLPAGREGRQQQARGAGLLRSSSVEVRQQDLETPRDPNAVPLVAPAEPPKILRPFWGQGLEAWPDQPSPITPLPQAALPPEAASPGKDPTPNMRGHLPSIQEDGRAAAAAAAAASLGHLRSSLSADDLTRLTSARELAQEQAGGAAWAGGPAPPAPLLNWKHKIRVPPPLVISSSNFASPTNSTPSVASARATPSERAVPPAAAPPNRASAGAAAAAAPRGAAAGVGAGAGAGAGTGAGAGAVRKAGAQQQHQQQQQQLARPKPAPSSSSASTSAADARISNVGQPGGREKMPGPDQIPSLGSFSPGAGPAPRGGGLGLARASSSSSSSLGRGAVGPEQQQQQSQSKSGGRIVSSKSLGSSRGGGRFAAEAGSAELDMQQRLFVKQHSIHISSPMLRDLTAGLPGFEGGGGAKGEGESEEGEEGAASAARSNAEKRASASASGAVGGHGPGAVEGGGGAAAKGQVTGGGGGGAGDQRAGDAQGRREVAPPGSARVLTKRVSFSEEPAAAAAAAAGGGGRGGGSIMRTKSMPLGALAKVVPPGGKLAAGAGSDWSSELFTFSSSPTTPQEGAAGQVAKAERSSSSPSRGLLDSPEPVKNWRRRRKSATQARLPDFPKLRSPAGSRRSAASGLARQSSLTIAAAAGSGHISSSSSGVGISVSNERRLIEKSVSFSSGTSPPQPMGSLSNSQRAHSDAAAAAAAARSPASFLGQAPGGILRAPSPAKLTRRLSYDTGNGSKGALEAALAAAQAEVAALEASLAAAQSTVVKERVSLNRSQSSGADMALGAWSPQNEQLEPPQPLLACEKPPAGGQAQDSFWGNKEVLDKIWEDIQARQRAVAAARRLSEPESSLGLYQVRERPGRGRESTDDSGQLSADKRHGSGEVREEAREEERAAVARAAADAASKNQLRDVLASVSASTSASALSSLPMKARVAAISSASSSMAGAGALAGPLRLWEGAEEGSQRRLSSSSSSPPPSAAATTAAAVPAPASAAASGASSMQPQHRRFGSELSFAATDSGGESDTEASGGGGKGDAALQPLTATESAALLLQGRKTQSAPVAGGGGGGGSSNPLLQTRRPPALVLTSPATASPPGLPVKPADDDASSTDWSQSPSPADAPGGGAVLAFPSPSRLAAAQFQLLAAQPAKASSVEFDLLGSNLGLNQEAPNEAFLSPRMGGAGQGPASASASGSAPAVQRGPESPWVARLLGPASRVPGGEWERSVPEFALLPGDVAARGASTTPLPGELSSSSSSSRQAAAAVGTGAGSGAGKRGAKAPAAVVAAKEEEEDTEAAVVAAAGPGRHAQHSVGKRAGQRGEGGAGKGEDNDDIDRYWEDDNEDDGAKRFQEQQPQQPQQQDSWQQLGQAPAESGRARPLEAEKRGAKEGRLKAYPGSPMGGGGGALLSPPLTAPPIPPALPSPPPAGAVFVSPLVPPPIPPRVPPPIPPAMPSPLSSPAISSAVDPDGAVATAPGGPLTPSYAPPPLLPPPPVPPPLPTPPPSLSPPGQPLAPAGPERASSAGKPDEEDLLEAGEAGTTRGAGTGEEEQEGPKGRAPSLSPSLSLSSTSALSAASRATPPPLPPRPYSDDEDSSDSNGEEGGGEAASRVGPSSSSPSLSRSPSPPLALPHGHGSSSTLSSAAEEDLTPSASIPPSSAPPRPPPPPPPPRAGPPPPPPPPPPPLAPRGDSSQEAPLPPRKKGVLSRGGGGSSKELLSAIQAHDKKQLRRVSSEKMPQLPKVLSQREMMLEQIRNKAFALKRTPSVSSDEGRPPVHALEPTDINVAAILEKANAIRQAFAGSDSDSESDSEWSD